VEKSGGSQRVEGVREEGKKGCNFQRKGKGWKREMGSSRVRRRVGWQSTNTFESFDATNKLHDTKVCTSSYKPPPNTPLGAHRQLSSNLNGQ
jgi:hypothetical protein